MPVYFRNSFPPFEMERPPLKRTLSEQTGLAKYRNRGDQRDSACALDSLAPSEESVVDSHSPGDPPLSEAPPPSPPRDAKKKKRAILKRAKKERAPDEKCEQSVLGYSSSIEYFDYVDQNMPYYLRRIYQNTARQKQREHEQRQGACQTPKCGTQAPKGQNTRFCLPQGHLHPQELGFTLVTNVLGKRAKMRGKIFAKRKARNGEGVSSENSEESPEANRAHGLDHDDYFMAVAILAGRRCKGGAGQGACLVSAEGMDLLSVGQSGSPGASTPSGEFLCNSELLCHAEMNAIVNSQGRKGGILYTQAFPCAECAKLIVQSGVKEVVFCSDKQPDNNARKILSLGKIPTRMYKPKGRKMEIDFSAL